MHCELIGRFHMALTVRRHAEATEGSSAEMVRVRDHAADEASNAAFDLATSYGWDALADEKFARWALKATPAEILVEGMQRALQNCQPDARAEAKGPEAEALVRAMRTVQAAGKTWSLEVMHGSGGLALSTPDFDGIFFATPDYDGEPNTIAMQLDLDGNVPDICDETIHALETAVPWNGDIGTDGDTWRRRVVRAIQHLVAREMITFDAQAARVALDGLYQAAASVQDNWHDCLTTGYPQCMPDFDEFVAQIAQWSVDVRSGAAK